jgi:hypothetical protein
MSIDDPENLLGALDRALHPVRRPNPLVILWRWRYELALLAALIAAAPWFAGLAIPVAISVVVFAALLLAVPPVRRVAWLRARAVVLQHRLRTAFVRARLHTNGGRIPGILWTSPREQADRVLLFLPAGLTERQLADEADRIAVACDGTHAEVLHVEGHRVVVWLVIVRR